ncbi:MAG TPA: hypothetical protein VK826_11040 [Bacteroidia bacterium]|nr:hypothetical protein [Bacteroidia bacterium]
MEARLCEGFGPLAFGSGSTECVRHFGEPDEREELEGMDDSMVLVCHYWDKGFSLFFDKDAGEKFTSVEIDSSFPLLLFGQSIFGKHENVVTKLLEDKGYKVSDTEQHEWGERRVTFDDIFADFYFEKGVLVSVNYSLPIGEIEERTTIN